jgi:MFS family permease
MLSPARPIRQAAAVTSPTREPTASPAAEPRLGRAYWRLWSASAIDNIGDGAFAAAVPLLAASITRDPRLVSAVSAATFLPWLLLSLPAGALVDRHDRVSLMWRSQALQAVAASVLVVLVAVGTAGIPALAGIAFVLGSAEVLFGNASTSALPALVPTRLLPKANGNQYAVQIVGQLFLGPPLGSLLFAVAVALPFGLDAGTFALSAALLATLPHRTDFEPDTGTTLRRSIAEGLRWLARNRLLRTLALLLGINNFCNQLGQATLVLLATQTLHVSDAGYGVLLSVAAIGGVIGGVVNARIARRIGALPALLGALSLTCVVYVAAGFAPDAAVLGILLGLNGFATTLWNVVTVSMRQRMVPARLLGRVNSVYRMLGWGLLPLGALTGGLIAHAFGLRAPFPIAGSLRAIALLAALPVLLPAMRLAAAE